MPRLQQIILYIAFPTLLAVLNALHGQLPEKSLSLLFWITHSLPSWLFCILGSQVVFRVLRPWRPPLELITVLGGVLGSVCTTFYTRLVFVLTGPLFHGINDPSRYAQPGFTLSYLNFYVEMFLGGILIWTALNSYYDRVLGYPRYRYGAAALRKPFRADSSAIIVADVPGTAAHELKASAPLFMSRLPPRLRTELIAIQAQDHYIKVYTTAGSTLILYRFRDALAELRDIPGLRVHRSFWAMRTSIVAIRPRGKTRSIELINGVQIPVSLSYKGAIEALDLPIAKAHSPRPPDQALRASG